MPAPEIRLSITPCLSDRTDYDVYFIDDFEGIVELLDFYKRKGNLYTSMLLLLRRTKSVLMFNVKSEEKIVLYNTGRFIDLLGVFIYLKPTVLSTSKKIFIV